MVTMSMTMMMMMMMMLMMMMMMMMDNDDDRHIDGDLPAYFYSQNTYIKLIIRHDSIDILSVCHDIHSIQSYMVMTII